MDTPAEPDSGKTPAKKPSAGASKRPSPGKKPASTTKKPAPATKKPGSARGTAGRTGAVRTPSAPADPKVADEPAAVSEVAVSEVVVDDAPIESAPDDKTAGPDEVTAEAQTETATEDAAQKPRRAFTLPKLTIPTLSAGSAAISRLGRAVDSRLHADEEAAEHEGAAEAGGLESLPSETDLESKSAPEVESDSPAEVAAEAGAATPDEPGGSLIPVPTDPRGDAAMLSIRGLTKRFDDTVAVNAIDLEVPSGTIYGIVGPNGAGKTTTLSMITGLLRPDAGTVVVHGADVWADPVAAKRQMGVLPDRLRLFDRLTGSQLLYYSAVLRGLTADVARTRVADLGAVFRIEDALGRLVSDYSSGMTKKVALAAAMIHAPRLLVLDEPFESVDPVSASTVTGILRDYTAAGGTVLLSSHSMALVERICDRVAVVVDGEILADGTVEEVRGDGSLEERFVQLAGGTAEREGVEWLHTFSD